MVEHYKKYQMCMQDKLHAGQYSHFPGDVGSNNNEVMVDAQLVTEGA